MGKLLRILVVVVLVLGGLALWLAILNYNRKEILVGRTQKMETALERVAATIERADPEPTDPPDLPDRDVSPVAARELETPDFATFWETYNHKLEDAGMEPFNLRSADAQAQLQRFFAVDSAGDRFRDPIRGGYRTTGENTMQALLDQVIERATQQYSTLNRSRAQLAALREEHVRTIQELNREKRTRRQNLVRMAEIQENIARLEREKREDAARISRLEGDKRDLQLDIAERTETIDRQREQMQNFQADIARLNDELERVRRVTAGPQPTEERAPDVATALTAGEKGRIISVEPRWGFAITELSPEFMTELLGPELDRPLPGVEMMVRRSGLDGPAGEFVTKIRLRHLVPEANIVIADVLSDWQQVTPREGDVLFY